MSMDALLKDGIVAGLVGDYPIPCAELCGTGHTGMRGRLIVHSPEAYFVPLTSFIILVLVLLADSTFH